MIKKIKAPDGTEQTIEGSPAEIAEYERAIKEQQEQPQNESRKKPGVLKGMSVEECAEFLAFVQSAIRSMPEFYDWTRLFRDYKPITTIGTGIRSWSDYTITYGTTSLDSGTIVGGMISSDLRQQISTTID